MTIDRTTRLRFGVSLAVVAAVAGTAGYYLHTLPAPVPAATGVETPSKRKILYYYDPMVPLEHYAKPGLSSMGMQTQPKYADALEAGGGAPSVTIDPGAMQSLGVRTVEARTGTLGNILDVTGTIDFNQRDVAIIQTRSAGFVQRVYGHAPGDDSSCRRADRRSPRPRLGRRAAGISGSATARRCGADGGVTSALAPAWDARRGDRTG